MAGRSLPLQLDVNMSLLDSLIGSEVSVELLAEEWLREYELDARNGCLSLTNLIFHTCGVTQNLPPSVFEVGWIDFVKAFEDKIPPSALSTYPIIDGRNLGKKIARNVCDFIGIILLKADENVLCDGFFFPHLCELLALLTKSSLRAFRHTATLIVVKMTSHLAKITRTLTSKLSKLDRQLSSEKRRIRRSSERIEVLENLLATLNSIVSETEQKINFHIDIVLPKRFRDIYAPIRLLCLEELEIWLLTYPMAFMEHKNLKYLGWALSDPSVMMRLKSIQILKKIYSSKELAKHMELFTLKFKERILTMFLDKNITVSVIAIQVISAIHRHNPEMIDEASKEYIFLLAYSQHTEIAKEAGAFIHQCITLAVGDQYTSQKHIWSLSLLELKNIIITTKVFENIPFLVDAMLCQPDVKYLTEWDCYTNILFYNENVADEKYYQENLLDTSLNYREERVIVSLMANTAQQILLDEFPSTIIRKKKLLIAKSLRKNTTDAESSVKFFLKFIPKLMKKYMPDADIIASLLSMSLTIDVNLIAKNQDIHGLFTSLLEISERHVDLEIHLACAKAMAHLCKGDSPTAIFGSSTFLDLYLKQTISSWRDSLKQYSQKFVELEDFSEIMNEEELIFKIEKNSKRLWVISCHFELQEFIDWEEIATLCRGHYTDDKGKHYPITTTVMRNSLKTSLSYILHELLSKNVEENDLLKYHIDDFLLFNQIILKAISEIACSVRITAFHCISEIMCIICKESSSSDLWKHSIETIVSILIENISALIIREGGFEDLSENEELDLITSYCSLILRGGLPAAAVISLLKNINTQMIFASWPCVETTLSTIQSWDMEEFSMFILSSLTSSYDEALEKEGWMDLLASQSFSEVMRNAVKIFKTYGNKMGNHIKSSLKFHLQGIRFTSEIMIMKDDEVKFPRIHFAHILIVFSPIVDPKYRGKLLRYLSEHKRKVKANLSMVSEEEIDKLPLFQDYESSLTSSNWVKRSKKQLKTGKRGRKNLNQEIPIEEEFEEVMEIGENLEDSI